MPTTYSTGVPGTYTVDLPENVKRIEFVLQGAGGGGEFVNKDTGASTAGATGGSTIFEGITAGGGIGGGVGGKHQGGTGGTASNNSSVPNNKMTFTNGGSGFLNKKDSGNEGNGAGASISGYPGRNGGYGRNGWVNFTATIYHYYPNIYEYSPDIGPVYMGGVEADYPCWIASYVRHYTIYFAQAFDNSNYTAYAYGIAPYTAKGGNFSGYPTGYVKQSSYMQVWFCKYKVSGAGTVSSYVQYFTIYVRGLRSATAGMGGGGGSLIYGTLERQDLLDAGIISTQGDRTGSLTVGAGGSTATGGLTTAGSSGNAYVKVTFEARATISVDNNPIVRGDYTTLRWRAWGDVDTAVVTPAPGNTQLEGSINIAPTQDTTYQIYTSGEGGTATATVDVIVWQPPTVTLYAGLDLDYGEQTTLSYDATYAFRRVYAVPTYTYTNGQEVVGSEIELTTGDSVVGVTFDSDIPYNDFGPTEVKYDIYVIGYGPDNNPLTASDSKTISINIDTKPENMIVPTSDEKFKDEDPVITPDSTVTTYKMEVLDIDIPVEIRSNRPIQVQIDDGEQWFDVQQQEST